MSFKAWPTKMPIPTLGNERFIVGKVTVSNVPVSLSLQYHRILLTNNSPDVPVYVGGMILKPGDTLTLDHMNSGAVQLRNPEMGTKAEVAYSLIVEDAEAEAMKGLLTDLHQIFVPKPLEPCGQCGRQWSHTNSCPALKERRA